VEPSNLPIPLPGPGEVDWPSLVDTATRAMGVEETTNDNGVLDAQTEAGMHGANLGQWVDDMAGHLGLDTRYVDAFYSKPSTEEAPLTGLRLIS